MDDFTFLEELGGEDATATLMILLPDASVQQLRHVSPFKILDKCPLLYHAFEFGAHGVRQASIETTSVSAIVSLLRYLYTGDYLLGDEPYPFLKHVEAFKIAEDFDVPELQVSAYVNFTRETEFACSYSTPPSDLCETIRYVYKHLSSQESRQQQSLLDTLLNYCLAVFKSQHLGEHADFRKVVYEMPEFHQDLCRTNMKREFKDEGSREILNLPVCRPNPYSREVLNKRALGDFQFELWQDIAQPTPVNDERLDKAHAKRRKSDMDGNFTLVHRPKNSQDVPTSESESESESSSDDDGFTMVLRPKTEPDDNDTASHAVTSDPLTRGSAMRQEPAEATRVNIASDDEGWDLIDL